jgi:hypothetical protein
MYVSPSVLSSVVRHRTDLQFLEGIEVECSGRVKEFKPHVRRKDLDSLLLVNLIVTPIPVGESISIEHLWFLRKQFKKIGKVPSFNERIKFLGKVYSYKRLGGKSIDRGLYGTTDFGVLPISFLL